MADLAGIKNLYLKYSRDPEGLLVLAKDLDIDPDGPLMLAFAWKCQAKEMGQFAEEEWIVGMKALKASTLEQLKKALHKVEFELAVPESFAQFYEFVFKYCKNSDRQTLLPKETAIVMWGCVLEKTNRCPFFIEWKTYLERDPEVKGINKDTWKMFLEFCLKMDKTFSNYSEDDVWPNVIDSFMQNRSKKS